MTELKLPSSSELRTALLQVLAINPAGMHTKDLDNAVAELLHLTPDQLSFMRSGNRSELSYRLAWERTHAKNLKLIERTASRIWRII